jgi:two-component system sensor histidine kinase RegB
VIIVDMARNLRERDRKLAAVREQALRNERLAALGTLAAGAAHELGTPLGTMAILTSELEAEYNDAAHAGLQSRLGILQQQIGRCKEALSVMSNTAGADRAEAGHRTTVSEFLDEVLRQWREQHPGTALDYAPSAAASPGEILAERTLIQALTNILNNAADASPGQVRLHADWTTTELKIEIADRGPGLASNLHQRLGKHPVTTKENGLGVGLYLAHATVERLGGHIETHDRDGGGTLTRITLPLLPGQGKL